MTRTADCEVLAVGAHPDDVELTVGGTLLLAKARGLRTAVCHLTMGEMGTRGHPEQRRREAEEAAQVLRADALEFLGLPDGHVAATDEARHRVIRVLREYRPRVVLAPHTEDLHPDHENAGRLVKQAAFLAGLARWDTGQPPWRPEVVLHYMSHTQFTPTLIVDVSEHLAEKRRAAGCYASQFHREGSTEPRTYISSAEFWQWWEGRARHWGHLVGVSYGEPLLVEGPIPTRDPFSLFRGFGKYRNS